MKVFSYRDLATASMVTLIIVAIISGFALLPAAVNHGRNVAMEMDFDRKQSAYLVRKAKWRTFVELMRKYHATGNVKWMFLAQATANFIQYEDLTKLNVCFCGSKEQPGEARIY